MFCLPFPWLRSGHLLQVERSRVITSTLNKVSSTVCDSSQHLRGPCSPSGGCICCDWRRLRRQLSLRPPELSQNRSEGVDSEGHPVQQCPGDRLWSPPAELGLVLGACCPDHGSGLFCSPSLMSLLCFSITLDVTQQHKCENSGKTKQMLFDKK